jgi:long-chain acyl-CoA synthetase
MNIYETIKLETRGFENKVAVVENDGVLTYEQLFSSIEKIAEALSEKSVKRYHRVGLLYGDCLDYITGSLAILSLGAVIVPISPEQPISEIGATIDRIALDFLVFEKGVYDSSDALPLQSEGFFRKEFFIKKMDNVTKPCREYYGINPAFIRFSSGTTGTSKGVVLSHETIIDRTDAADKALKLTHQDTVLWVLSMSYHFVVSILLYFRRAATIVLCARPFPEALVEGVIRHGGTFIYASPFHYNLLSRSELLSTESLKNIRMAISTAMKLPDETADLFSARFGFELTEAYGIIEVGLPFIRIATDKRGSVGKPLPDYEVVIINKCNDGTGEIYIKGKGMLDAYYSPWQGREAILRDGWFKTGDLGRIDDSGSLTIVGRDKDIINFAGMKIFAYEVEAIINQYPLVEESLVFGVPHPQYGQLPVAKIVVSQGSKEAFDPDDLRRFCYQRLAQYKVPKDFERVDQLAKTASGKIRRS